MKQIKDFQIGETITGFYLLKKLEIKQTAAMKDYFDMILSDKTGDIPAKVWDVSEETKANFTSPMVVNVQGVVQTFKEKPDFKVTKLYPTTEEEKAFGMEIENFIQTAPVKSNVLIQTIQKKIDSISSNNLQLIVQYCFNKVSRKLAYYPAAKSVHHAYHSGLAYHEFRMLELAEFICKQRPFLYRDILIAGVILHDLGKVEELEAGVGIATTYSDKGRLIGHISIVQSWIVEAAMEFKFDLNSDEIIHLQHLVLSHHGKGEWGSPVQPQTPEAVALHHIDMIDAKLQAVEDTLSMTPENETWTKPIVAIDNNSIYKGIGEY